MRRNSNSYSVLQLCTWSLGAWWTAPTQTSFMVSLKSFRAEDNRELYSRRGARPRTMPHPVLSLEVSVTAAALDGPQTRSASRSSGRPSSGKWSATKFNEALPASRFSPYGGRHKRKAGAAEASCDPDISGSSPSQVKLTPPYAQRQAPRLVAAASSSAVISPMTGLAESMAHTWPISARTRSRMRAPGFSGLPRRLTALDASETLSADLLTMVPGSQEPPLPQLEVKTKGLGRRALRLEPLPLDACPNAGLLGLVAQGLL